MRILVPLDGSPLSERALTYAMDTQPEATIVLLHVIDPVEAIYVAEAGGPRKGQSFVAAARERGEEICNAAADIATDLGFSVTTAVESGNPAREILAAIDDHDVDAIVMGSHGRDRLTQVFLGSTAETVVHRSPVPVTVVR
ncbi:universal stress protein [Haloarchaeobius sp. TZWWS8]|uniref:universal stress protein n=1 Tax=Haloarchaeobius sp. TZWWS8 TaxID=3446121 RepID=UPI003EBE346B